MDLLPTIARITGAEVPQDRIIDGKDIWPLMSGVPDAVTPHEAFFYYWPDQLHAVRSGRWKLHVHRPEWKGLEHAPCSLTWKPTPGNPRTSPPFSPAWWRACWRIPRACGWTWVTWPAGCPETESGRPASTWSNLPEKLLQIPEQDYFLSRVSWKKAL